MSLPSAQAISCQAASTSHAVSSLSRPVSAWSVMIATIIKELRFTKRYLPNLVGRLVELSIRLGFLVVLASTITISSRQVAQDLSGRNLYIFVQGAIILFVFQGPAFWSPISIVTADLYNGTLEYLYSNPGSRYAYYVGAVIGQIMVNSVIFIPFYLCLVIYSQSSLKSMLSILLVCGITLITLTSMGILVALTAILWRQVQSIGSIVERFFEFLSGAYIPLTAFPQFVQYLGYLVPYTWAYDLIRYYSLGPTWHTILPVWQEWVLLAVFAIAFLLLSRYLLGKVEELAKRKGLHLI